MGVTYTIKPGDTLSEIAQKNGTTVSTLASLNNISNVDLIQSGRTIKIPSSSTSSTKTSSEDTSDSSGFNYKNFSYGAYQESDAVKAADSALQAHLANKPGEYTSQWQTQLNDVINKILNREKFSYDLNGDALYQQYKDKYIQQGKMAMQDTMGQAAAMTGGYGNSYAATAGNQAYQASLQNLNDIVPELWQMAYDRYNQEGQDLYNQSSLLGAQEERDYGRHRDSVSDWQNERGYLADRYDSERSYDYGKYSDDRNLAYNQYTEDRAYAYQADRDKVADDQWEKDFGLKDRELTLKEKAYDEEEKKNNVTTETTEETEETEETEYTPTLQEQIVLDRDKLVHDTTLGGYKAVNTKGVTNFQSGIRTKNEFYGRDSAEKQKYGTYEAYIEGKLDEWLSAGKLTEDEVATLIAYYGLA